MGLFSALAGVASSVAQGVGGLFTAGLNIGTQALTGIVSPVLQTVGGIIPNLLGSSGAPGAQVTAPAGYGQGYYVPPYAGGTTPSQAPPTPPGWVPYASGAAYAPGQAPGGTYSLGGGPPVTAYPALSAQDTVSAEMRELAVGSMASPWKATCGGSSLGAQNHIQINPATGAIRWFGPMGKPILWSGDLAACKRVKRVGARANRAVKRGGR